jgi:ribosomal protein L24E
MMTMDRMDEAQLGGDDSKDIKRLTGIASQGKLYVRGDSKIFRFQNGKSESLFLQRKNPRRIAWTVLYRRQHRKGISEVCINQMPVTAAAAAVAGLPSIPLHNRADTFYRRLPRSEPAALSRPSEASLVLLST